MEEIDNSIVYVGKLPAKDDEFICAFHASKGYGHIPLYTNEHINKLKQEIRQLKAKLNG